MTRDTVGNKWSRTSHKKAIRALTSSLLGKLGLLFSDLRTLLINIRSKEWQLARNFIT